MTDFIIGFLIGVIVSAFYWISVFKKLKAKEIDNE